MARSESIEKIFELALELASNTEGLYISEITDKYEISRRTAERWLELIGHAFPGMVLVDNFDSDTRKKRWKLSNDQVVKLSAVGREELSALDFAIKLTKKHGASGEHSAALESLYNKLRVSIGPRQRSKFDTDIEALSVAEGIAMRPGPRMNYENNILDTWRTAILARQEVQLKYISNLGRKSRMTVQPYGMLYGDRSYLVARGKSSGQDLLLKLENVLEVKMTEDTYEQDESFSIEKYAHNSFGVYQEKPFDVEWIFSKKVADDAAKYIFHPSQTTEKLKDGRLRVKFTAGGALEMAWHLYKWGNHVKVVKPKGFWPMVEKIRKYPILP